jgi:5'-deoxynucleotidase YfbR-like HD superfamily hydrolase
MNLQSLFELRRGGNVRRLHCEPMEAYTCAQHCHGVAMILYYAFDDPAPELIKAALVHDLAEDFSGDMPAPAKWASPELRQILHNLETNALQTRGVLVALTPEQEKALHAADYLELDMYCLEQRTRGNSNADVVHVNIHKHFDKLSWEFEGGARLLSLWTNICNRYHSVIYLKSFYENY